MGNSLTKLVELQSSPTLEKCSFEKKVQDFAKTLCIPRDHATV